MKRWLCAVIGLVALLPASASADDEQLCGAYAAVGRVMAVEVLDVTFREFIALGQNRNPELQNRIGLAMTNAWSGAQLMAVSELPEDETSLLGEAAGEAAVTLLMQGVSDSADEIANIMRDGCVQLGMEAIIANKRAANEAIAQTLQTPPPSE